MTQAAENPDDNADIVEPTDDEIAAAAKVEADDAAREARKTAPKKRGPGRPPGAKNKTTATREATTRAASTRTSSAAPRSTPAAMPGTADAESRAERKRQNDARQARVRELTDDMLKHRVSLVRAVGMATGLPAQYLVGVEGGEDGHPVLDSDTGRPVEVLTHYGQALAPADWQVRTCVEAYVRMEESEQGQKLLLAADRLMPYVMMTGALAALGMYAMTVMQASAAIKPMVILEMQQAAAAQAAAGNPPPQAPGTPPGGGVPG